MSEQGKRSATEDPWESGTFEGNRRLQLLEDAKLSFAEKIEWVDQANRLAIAFEKARANVRPIVPAKPDSAK